MSNLLESLRRFTTVVADTGDFESIRHYRPTDATTNPSLILKAVQQDRYRPLLEQVRRDYSQDSLELKTDRLLVRFGQEILNILPGRVSTEVDARLSFDTHATLERARTLIALYEAVGVPRERILIKIASTWEGIQAARQLQTEGIRCNLTLLFSLTQAQACADANVTLISPFVGRIYDWHKKQQADRWDEAANHGIHDPGAQSVSTIYRYYKEHGIRTEVMGASFRNVGQIKALAGCDLLTISPDLLEQLQSTPGTLEPLLVASTALVQTTQATSEAQFRYALNQDAMATEKLAEGIRAFISDAHKLDALLQ